MCVCVSILVGIARSRLHFVHKCVQNDIKYSLPNLMGGTKTIL